MFKETFYEWLKNDFAYSQQQYGNGKSFLAKYYRENCDMGEGYRSLKVLVEKLKETMNNTSKEEIADERILKEEVFDKAQELYRKSRLQVLMEVENDDGDKSFKGVNPFKGMDVNSMTAKEVCKLADIVLDARIDKAIKEYIYNIDHGRKTDNTLNIIDLLFEEQGVDISLSETGILRSRKAQPSVKKHIDSEEFREEAKRVYNIVRANKNDNLVLPLYQEKAAGIYIIGRKNINENDWRDGVDRIDYSGLGEEEKNAQKRNYESSTVYYCFMENPVCCVAGCPDIDEVYVTVCYDLEDAIKEFGRHKNSINKEYQQFNIGFDEDFIVLLGDNYRMYFSED